jgi:hypothetical protein
VYISPHKKNAWKRREVGILLIGTFVEDISMYMTRNPDYAMLLKIFQELNATQFKEAPLSLKSLLVGRTHQCAIQIFDLVSKNEEGDKFKADMMNLAF